MAVPSQGTVLQPEPHLATVSEVCVNFTKPKLPNMRPCSQAQRYRRSFAPTRTCNNFQLSCSVAHTAL